MRGHFNVALDQFCDCYITPVDRHPWKSFFSAEHEYGNFPSKAYLPLSGHNDS